MNETSWNECLRNNTSLNISSNKSKAISLIDTARQRIKFTEKKKAEDYELKFVFENYYTSLIEIIHAILNIKGYKVLNHLCLGWFIKDVLKEDKMFKEFDNLRIRRNDIVYYGKDIDVSVLKENITDIKSLIKKFEKIYSEMEK